MKKYIRYLALATVLLLPFLIPFAGSKAQRVKQRVSTDESNLKRISPQLLNQKIGVDSTAKAKLYGNLDIRINEPSEASRLAKLSASSISKKAQKHALGMEKAMVGMRAGLPGLDAKVSPITGAVEVLRSNTGELSEAAQGRSGEDIVQSFIANNSGVYGLGRTDIANLKFLGESVSPGSGMRMVRVEQTVNGLPVFQSETRFILDRDGRVFRSTGLMVPNATSSAPAFDVNQLISAEQALVQAMASLDITVSAPEERLITSVGEGPTKTEVVANNEQISGNVPSKLVYFPIAPGVLIPAWSQITFTNGIGDWYTLVDANTGKLLWRKNIRDNASTHEARFRVYVQADGKTPADSPAPNSPSTAITGDGTQFTEILPTIVNMSTVQNILASPDGWINDCPGGVCTAAQTQTIGNNVHAYMDAQGGANANVPDTNVAFVLDGNGKPTGNPDTFGRNRDFLGTAPRNFETGFLPVPQSGNPEAGQTATGNGNNGTLAVDQYRRGVVTQLFYVSNWYHDQLFSLGFDEAAGNFQETNFSGMGVGSDRVLAEAQDSSGTNNANFSTPPDGVEGRAQMYRFIGPTIDRDGDLDAEILIHELSHGTSNRLIGNAAGLNWDVGAGMGEGWSDFYALSLLNNTNADDPNGRYATGAYATYKFFFPTISPAYLDNYVYGIRRFPYSTDNAVNPLTWADVDDVTNNLSGGIPADPLDNNHGGGFEVHNIGEVWALTLWEVRSRIIAANGGDVPTGNQIMLQLVTDALKMTPIDPTFIAARDALIDADCVTNACANEQSIWDGFADRGLGYKASAPLAYMFGFVAGHMGIKESFSSPDLDVQAVTVDDSSGNNNGAIDPGEPIKLTVSLKNPWRNASKNVASATGTLSSSTPGVVIYDGTSTYPAIAAQGTAAGDTFFFTVPTSAICGQSIKFTLTPNSTLGASSTREIILRVGAPSGTATPVTYTRSAVALGIPDFTPRGVFDSLTITDDFEIADLNFRVDSLTHTWTGDVSVMLKAPNGYGADFISVIGGLTDGGPGDNLINTVVDDSATAPNDFLVATAAQAPFTDDFLPIFNVPSWTLAGFPPADAVGQLGRLNGTSTQGTWNVLVSDQALGDTGTLNSWSLIVTPRAFSCVAFAPAANVSGTKTVSGTFAPGGSITYTVTLTNSGSGVQADNAGDEFTDTLPEQLTLVSAIATSGAITTDSNIVHWNGTLAPLGDSVTITITATINAGVAGTVSNQGTINYDANVDGANESSRVTDDPGVGGANDPTSFTSISPANVSGTKTKSGGNAPGSAITYTVVLSNSGSGAQLDNAGNEFTDTLPASLTLVSAAATSGTATTLANTVNWNGSISGGGSVTITITATINSVPDGTVVSNQGTINYDADGNATNEATRLTDDPSVGGAGDPTAFTVLDINNPPNAFDDALSSVAEDSGQRTIPIATLLANDNPGPANESGQMLTLTGVSNPVGGTVSNDAINVYFTPAADYNGPASFLYTVTDNGTSNGSADPQTSGAGATFTITEVNDSPTAVNDTLSDVAEDSGQRTILSSTLTTNDSKGPANENGQTLIVKTVGNPVGGTVSMSGGNVLFTPTANYTGPASFDYTIEDNGTTNGAADPKTSGVATASFTITESNDAPAAVNDTLTSSAEDSAPRAIPFADLTGNDSKGPANESGQTLTVISANNAVGGSVVLVAGFVVFTPDDNYNGPASFDYTLEDNGTTNGVPDPKTSGTATVSFNVTEVNDAPTAVNDTVSNVAEDSGERTIAFADLTGNDIQGPANESGQTLIVKTVGNPIGVTVILVGETVRVTPLPDFNGPASFQYTMRDNGTTSGFGDEKFSSATVSFNITAQSDAPSVTNATTNANTQTESGLVISRNPADGAEVTHFKITASSGGLLSKNNGTTSINNGDFITFAEGNAGLKFTPGTTNGSFLVQASTGASDAGLSGSTVQATIIVNPLGGVISFGAANYSVAEGAGFRTITVERSGDNSQAVTVQYTSSDHSATENFISCNSPGAGFASSRCDFTTSIGTLRFAAGETSKTLNVLISNDNYVEGPETLELTLSNPTGGAVLGVPQTAILTITDDATQPATNPIDSAADFVRAQYHDILGREPDAAGLAFWTDNIEKCNDASRRPAGQTVAQCTEKQRESTAIAFFQSPEFQMTGGFVYHLYKGSLTGSPNYDGGSPNSSPASSLGRFPTFLEFMHDMSQVAEGIVVNGQISGAVVEANRNALAAAFVERPEFIAKYGGLNNTLYVQELFNTTGIAAAAAPKQALVAGLNDATETRGSVLRKVVDGTVVLGEGTLQFTTPYGQAFINQENRRLFVYLEYIGYLRRNPDPAGFVFWLGKLNQSNGDPVQAEMVRSFILSPEYRIRFGQP